ncbi:MAG: hypothetical protein IH969_08995 [Candidatus Krumholzibacteriota bacterium]|nr:hypothetical protein [Candidatus Krumholzibacteriota bacterium]
MTNEKIIGKHRDNPYTIAPPGWHTSGVDYGDFCKCSKCGFVGRSTMSFDFRAKEPGDALTCDQCEGMSTHETEKHISAAYSADEGKHADEN